ncbi:restriction endonuclease subunit S [Phocaeicola vulgatus]|uniref:restriction endonuclease subunit S n=2 Tax=Bacteroidales TaxID=171549 RepID=UPI0031B5AA4A
MADNNENKVLNVPHLRFPEFSGEWEEHTLSEYLEFKNGLNPDAKRIGSGLPFISVMDILSEGVINYDNIRGKVNATEKEIECFGVKDGDLLFQRSSETLEDVGRANVYMDNRTAIYGGFVIRGRKIGNYDPLFFKYLLATPLARKRTCRMGAGAQHFNIGQEGLSKISLYFPSIEEQRKIAEFLSLIDERIATQNKIIEDLKKLKSAIIHRCYSSQTNMIPLSELLKQCSDRNRSGSDLQVLSVSNKYGFIAQSNQFEDREVASDDTSNYKVVKKGMFAYNPARINVGSIALYEMDGNGIVSPMYVCFTTKSELLPSYLKYYFASQTFKHEMYKRLEGSVRLCLTFEELCNIEIHLPSIEQQKNISKYISKIENNLSLVDSIFSKYQQQRRYLLSQMFI